MTTIEEKVIDVMKETKRMSYGSLIYHPKLVAITEGEIRSAISNLIDYNRLEEFHENKVKFIRLGMNV